MLVCTGVGLCCSPDDRADLYVFLFYFSYVYMCRFVLFWQGYLAHHHDMIVLTAVDETRRAAAECSLVRQREWEVDSWRQTKKVNIECRIPWSLS